MKQYTDLLDKIRLDDSLKNRVVSFIEENKKQLLAAVDNMKQGDYSLLESNSDIFRLSAVVLMLPHLYEKYSEHQIGDDVFFDTVADINIWCQNNSNKGLKNYNWIKNHLSFELFKIGRLQYQLYICNNDTLDYDLLPFEYGEKMIFVHVPQGEKLIYTDCIKSLTAAKSFFAKYFPCYNYKFFFCESWLLYDNNFLFMKPDSNILQFASMFNVVYSVEDDSQAIERIFGKRKIIPKHYPENTTLQKSAKDFIKNGGKLGLGIGIIDKNDI